MASKIDWTDEVWNPVTGCTPISTGCARCYAKGYAARLHGAGISKYANGFNVTCHPGLLNMPSKWKVPKRVFVNSMSDLFHAQVPDQYILDVFAAIGRYPHLTFQVLTKRAQRLISINNKLTWHPNIWMGVTVEEDAYADRVELLKQTGAQVKFVSVEPLIAPVPSLDVRGLDWVIVGGEKAVGARPMLAEWVMPIKEAARVSGIPFFFKQWGSKNTPFHSNMFDGDVWHQFPG
ncbi:DUF5131 family protein [Fundidesulfovibrio soli]|uniref:DUF5131 family protein n=1 Tax=Fundidesulfovibrio soli TaxID=2922716 RepID=UPI001FAF2F58|nr:phage Gp37/Gp68 family protein [Fundidesulfovibrio soli]